MSDDKKPFHNPFDVLRPLRDSLPQVIVTDPAPTKPAATASTERAGKTYARAVVRMERTGRGGKEVTVVEQLDLPERERPTWLAALKSALGCGGSLEGTSLMLQGDHRKRLPAILGARGVKKVIVS
jgi:translation initiation factor 1